MMVADWIIGMFAIAATLKIVLGCVLVLAGIDDDNTQTGIANVIVGIFMAVLCGMHYSGM